ncbi:MAG: DeoR/GlpR family DNA-binding transcription regulator [Frankiaceae bacterium]
MYAEERQQEILARARARGRVDVTSLAEEFDVASETVRRDLTVLERHGVLRRVHGGALPLERLGFEPELATRDTVRVAEKERIGKAALDELPEEGAILIDAGTTTGRLAQAMAPEQELTVVTNALPIAMTLSVRPNLTVMFIGGRIRARTLSCVDAWAMDALRNAFVDVAFIGTNGITVERGLTTPDPAEAAVKQAMIASARRSVVLADSSKVGAVRLARFAMLDDIDTLITDDSLDEADAAALSAAGLRLVLA